ADFDGDQMAVHVPLSIEAQAEARFLMLAANNILKPQDGRPVVSPTQDMVMGCYYLTAVREDAKGTGKAFASQNEAVIAYQTGEISLQAQVKVLLEREIDGKIHKKIIETTVGKLLFNEAIPQDLGYVDRTEPESAFILEVDKQVTKKDLNRIVDRCFRRHGPTETSEVLDRIKNLGYKYATVGGITIGYKDITVPAEKKDLIAQAEHSVTEIEENYKNGLITNAERRRDVIDVWKGTTEKVAVALKASMDHFNPIYMMANSGARGSDSQITQLTGMRGLMADPSGQIIEVPIKSNFREGLNVLEFFISSHGARKGLADTALRTADSGYLTRRLVDVAQDVIIREDDCFSARNKQILGMPITAIYDDKKVVEPFGDRILGRYTSEAVFHPETGEEIMDANELITYDLRDKIVEAGITKIECRTAFNCRTEHGVCSKCYGTNLTTGNKVDIGDAVGIIAAQAIGEPGTQLTMRTFHTGGVASAEDITQGLPRVEEIYEARKPKGLAVLTEIPGTVSLEISVKKREATITPFDGSESRAYPIPYGSKLRVEDGQNVEAGEALTDGPINPHEILRIRGMKEVQAYMLREVQKVYRQQGVEISDKHIEIIIRQMLKKVQIEKSGDTDMLPGELVDLFRFLRENEAILVEEKIPADCSPKLLGITKAALATDSFLSAASFQETTRILSDAAIKGKVDPLLGLKENIIIGKLIPAGLGLRRYRDVSVQNKSVPVVIPMTENEEGFKPDDLLKNDNLPPISSYEEIMRHLTRETLNEDEGGSDEIDALLEDFDKLIADSNDTVAADAKE
ncbi:MAG: DNA-directed RNA polymerase subunit beta', partial [Clostridiales bacterium]|nr:DNA-directed RNA polymerase subunit beta' [Clostridiales bacterium]